jgi:hypothetical protein
MQSELETYLDQLISIKQDAPGIVAGLSDAQFNWRPAANRWSIAECFNHLNASARELLARIDESIRRGRERGLTSAGPFALRLIDRVVARALEPPARLRVRTVPALAPPPERANADTMKEFFEWQERFAERLRAADGLDLGRIRTASPVSTWLSYSLGGAFAVFLAHERRHLWQARQVRNDRAFP